MKPAASREKGQALVIIVVSLIGLLGITALAVDGGNAYAQKLAVQSAADTAALGGALARIRGEDWVAITYKIAASSGYKNGDGTIVQVYSPPISGVNAGDLNYIQVKITSQTPTYFADIVGVDKIRLYGEAVTRTKRPEITEILHGNAVISLAPTSDCDKKRSFDVSGQSTLDIEGGGIFVNSNNPACALTTWGSGSIRLVEGEMISVVGGAAIQKAELLTPFPPQTGAPSISYPPPFLLPKIGCKKDAAPSDDGKSMSPGAWAGDFPPVGVTGLQPGAYCIGGDFVVTGTLEGNGVVFLVSGGRVHLEGTINLSAPNSKRNKNNGLLLYLPPNNHHIVSLNGNADSTYRGTILAPGSEIRLKGNESGFGFHSQIIGYRIMSDGESNIVIKYKDKDNYDAMTMPEIEISQ